MRYLSRRTCALALVLLLLLIGVVWGYRHQRATQNLAKFEALTQAMATAGNLPEVQRQELRTSMRSAMQQLSPDQRNRYFAQQRQRRTVEMKRVIGLPRRERNTILDREIKQAEERRKQMQQAQKAPGKSGSGSSAAGGKSARPLDPAQREQRSKQRLDMTTPEERAVSSEYRKLLNERRGQLGLPPATGRGPRY